MTGTGTQNDPYIVDNTADFLEAVAQSGVYVQLGSDIDVAADGYDYIGAVTVNALSINGNGFAIRNATFQPGSVGSCIVDNNANSVWLDISFLDCAVKPTSGTSAAFIYGNQNSFIGMKLSLQVQPLSRFYLFNRANASNCAADITMNGGTICISFYAQSLSNSTFFIRGSYSLDRIIMGASGSNSVQVQNVGFVFDGSLAPGSYSLGDYTSFVGCYFAFADSATLPVDNTLTLSLGLHGTSGQNVVFSVGSGVSAAVTTPSGFPRLTTAQMKDAAYLQSIGWLP